MIGWPGVGDAMAQFYRGLAFDAARHEDCERAKKFYLRAYENNDGVRTLERYMENEPWCDYQLNAQTVPSKVRVSNVREGHATDELRAIAAAMPSALEEELGGSGVALEVGGAYNGGVFGLYLSFDSKSNPMVLKVRLTRDDNQPDVESSVNVTGNNVDFAALAAPLLKVLKAGASPGNRRPVGSVSTDVLAAFGTAEELLNNDKYEEANKAFEAVLKKAPDYRPAKVRAAYAAARKGSQ